MAITRIMNVNVKLLIVDDVVGSLTNNNVATCWMHAITIKNQALEYIRFIPPGVERPIFLHAEILAQNVEFVNIEARLIFW